MLESLERRLGPLDEPMARALVLVGVKSPQVLGELVSSCGGGRAALELAAQRVLARWKGADSFVKAAEEELKLLEKHSISLLTPETERWPPSLLTALRPPPLLYVKGRLPDLTRTPGLALVGSRSGAEYGERIAYGFAAAWAQMGGTVVSGGARGVDTAAHRGCLDRGGATVAVMGSGLLKPFPVGNRDLFEEISAHGAQVSELPLRGAPLHFSFPERNRIIAGLAAAVTIVQARANSGALYTARFALKCDRRLYTVPGPIDVAACAGGLKLLVEGVPPLVGTQGLVSLYGELANGPPGAPLPSLPLAEEKRTVSLGGLEERARLALEHVAEGLTHMDDLAASLGMSPGELCLLFCELELNGWVEKRAGNQYICNVRLER